MSKKDVLYMGDSSLETAASYLSLILENEGLSYDYVPSGENTTLDQLSQDYALYILSDYPAVNIGDGATLKIVEEVRQGAGLLMIGGWESFQGQSGGFHGTALSELLPVLISPVDDRVNSADPCCVVPVGQHSITDELPFEAPPLVAGYNRFTVKTGGEEILSVIRYSTRVSPQASDTVAFEKMARDPFLVLGSSGRGRVAALASDLAPHWVGGFVDWGEARVTLSGIGREVEVGEHYLTFVSRLLAWFRSP